MSSPDRIDNGRVCAHETIAAPGTLYQPPRPARSRAVRSSERDRARDNRIAVRLRACSEGRHLGTPKVFPVDR